MVPVYAIAAYCQIQWYWRFIYYQVLSNCYEAFAIASFFALLCHYIAPDLHAQKDYFRRMRPVRAWVLPLNWFAKCCGGQRGIWRTPKSGLTWFNIIWIGIYQYCFVRVTMTIAAVLAQYYNKYCESSNSPVFGHIWVCSLSLSLSPCPVSLCSLLTFPQINVIEALAVTVAMYCVIQFYVQLRHALSEHRPFLKVLSIKLVIFLSFWQTAVISVATSSTFQIVHPNSIVAYPDIKVGIPALILCIEMACFAILHLWAFPYAPYRPGAKPTFFPGPDLQNPSQLAENELEPPRGGPLGLYAIWDALNLWDFVKAFSRGVRWLFCGVRRRKEDISYKMRRDSSNLDMDHFPGDGNRLDSEPADVTPPRPKPFPRRTTDYKKQQQGGEEEQAGLIDAAMHAPSTGNPSNFNTSDNHSDTRSQRYSSSTYRDEANPSSRSFYNPYDEDASLEPLPQERDGPAYGIGEDTAYDPYRQPPSAASAAPWQLPERPTSAQAKVAGALWGQR